MKAYQSFLRRAGTPIGIVGAVMLTAWFVAGVFDLPPNEDAWTAQCDQLAVGNTVLTEDTKMGNQHFCIMLTPVEDYPVRNESIWKAGCLTLGGTYRSKNYVYTCYIQTIVEGLGARETYGETP